MAPKLPSRGPKSAPDFHPSAQAAVRRVESTRQKIGRLNPIERAFLDKYRSDSVLEAVQKEDRAAVDFIEFVCRNGKFGSLTGRGLGEVIVKSVECSHDAGFSFIQNASKFGAILDAGQMRDALFRSVLLYGDCEQYFLRHYRTRFARIEVSHEVHFQLSQMDRNRSRFSS